METATHNSHNLKIDDALKVLNQAAKDKKEDLSKLVTEKYSHIREAFSDLAEQNRDTAEHLKRRASEFVKEGRERATQTAASLDEEAHRSPWKFVCGAAVAGLMAGVLLSRTGGAKS